MTTQAPTGIELTQVEPIEAYSATQADRDAVKDEEVDTIHVDVSFACTRAVAATTRAARYAEDIARLPVPPDLLARVMRFAMAATHAHVMHNFAETPSPEIAAMSEPLYETREMLISGAKALVSAKLIPADRLGKLSGTRGHRDLGFDLMGLCTLYRDAWPTIQGRTAIRFEDIDPIHQQATKLMKLVGLRDDREKLKTHTFQQRARAFILLDREYDQLRRALTFVLWGVADVSDIAPAFGASLRTKSRIGEGEEDVKTPDAESPAAPATSASAVGMTDVGGPFTGE